jgi:hypothetical protein
MFVEHRVAFMELGKQYWDDWTDMPLKDLPLKEVREKVGYFYSQLKELAVAGRKRDCDWEVEGRPEGLALLIPEIQGYRGFARIVAVKARLEMAEGKLDQALDTLRSGLSLGRNLAKGPSVIYVLVGAAIMEVMYRRVEELIQQPGAPNLYWSLSVLPRKLADVDYLMNEDVGMIERLAPWRKRLENGPINQEQVRACQREADRTFNKFNFALRPQTFGDALRQAVQLSAVYPEARAFLKARGIGGDELDAMPVFQAAALYAFADHREAVEEAVKWAALPEGMNHPGYWAAVERWQKATARLDQLFFRGLLQGLLGGPSGALDGLLRVEARAARRVAALRCLEALRLYAAAHEGRLPADLDAVKEVPVPHDPVTGRPFRYELDGDKAILTAPGVVRPFGKLDPLAYEVVVQK